MSMPSAGIVAAALVIGSFFVGGRYQVTPAGTTASHGIVYVVDRFTGKIFWCGPTFCKTLDEAK
jgi:hypothetical protein